MTDEELRRLFEEMRQHVDGTAEQTRRHVDGTAERLDGSLDALRLHVDSTANALRRHFDVTAEDMRRHFDVSTEEMRRRYDLVAEALQLLDEKVDRKTASIETRMEEGFAETQAMIKFSNSALDRRVSALEKAGRGGRNAR